jgi:hypothetical protein
MPASAVLVLTVVGCVWYALKFAFNSPVKFPKLGAVIGPSAGNIACTSFGMGVLATATDCSDRLDNGLFALVIIGLLGLLTDLSLGSHHVQPGSIGCCVACMYILGAAGDNSSCSVICINGAVCLVILLATRAAMLMPRQGTDKGK